MGDGSHSGPISIGFEATAAVRQQAGIGRYARELLRALSQLETGDRYQVVYATGGATVELPDLPRNFQRRTVPLSDRTENILWQRLRLPIPIEFRTGRLDVFHSPDFSLPPSLAPSIVTVHDLTFEVLPQFCYPSLGRYLHAVVPRAIRRARAVIVPSTSTKSAITRLYGTEPGKIHVIAEGVSLPPNPIDHSAWSSTSRIPGPFVLAVGTLEPRKNYERLLQAHALLRARGLDITLVIAGRLGWLYENIFKTHQSLGLGDAVIFLHDADDVELAHLYQNAEITVYPSLYEGFGLPALEALAFGSPLACTGTSSLPEVVGDAALRFDPWDVEDIAGTMERLLTDSDLKTRLRMDGPRRAAAFTWKEAARQTNDLYHRVAGG